MGRVSSARTMEFLRRDSTRDREGGGGEEPGLRGLPTRGVRSQDLGASVVKLEGDAARYGLATASLRLSVPTREEGTSHAPAVRPRHECTWMAI